MGESPSLGERTIVLPSVEAGEKCCKVRGEGSPGPVGVSLSGETSGRGAGRHPGCPQSRLPGVASQVTMVFPTIRCDRPPPTPRAAWQAPGRPAIGETPQSAWGRGQQMRNCWVFCKRGDWVIRQIILNMQHHSGCCGVHRNMLQNQTEHRPFP